VLKVCCIASIAEAEMAVRAGAAALGLVAQMPSGPGPIPEQLIAEIAAAVPPPIATFLLTSHTEPGPIILQHRRCRTNTIQLTDALRADAYPVLRAELPGVKLVQVIHVAGADALEEARAVAPHVDALLLDSGNPKLQVKELGGTGRVHDWQVSRRIVETVSRPVFLAGGLNPQNVGGAVAMVRPFGVDVCSGLRTAGRLDEAKLAAFADVLAGAPIGSDTQA
jgi:phosphoribosylanthranilate isomerase